VGDDAGTSFSKACLPPGFDVLAGWHSLRGWLLEQQGFGGFAVRAASTGLWSPVVSRASATGGAGGLLAAGRLAVPIVKILGAQGLPISRVVVAAGRRVGYLGRTRGRTTGLLLFGRPHDPARAQALTDAVFLQLAEEEGAS
jgi:hypothetical protein